MLWLVCTVCVVTAANVGLGQDAAPGVAPVGDPLQSAFLFDDSVPTPASPEEGPPPTFEEMLSRLDETDERITTLETDYEEFKTADEEFKGGWFSKYSLGGYAQFRINENVWLDDGSAPPQTIGDTSVGENRSFLIRRARLIFSGDVNDYISVYLQSDFASNVPGSPDSNQFVQIRDWYADIHFDKDHVYRIRVGQSKLPFGWENMQSSRNRIPLDRNDALNSASRNERDLGAFFYWTPKEDQEFFDYVVDEGLRGSGNYGVFGIGIYNGQGGSLQEQNDNLHMVTRLTLPFTFANCQRMEVGVQAYTGMYTVLSSPISPLGVGAAVAPAGSLTTGNVSGIVDQRIAGSFIYYPQPWGFQSEWTVGRGPALNQAQTAITDRPLYGGYAMVMYREVTDCYGELWPFARYNYYRGGYKSERNAPYMNVDEWEMGLEWQFNKYLELCSMYTITDRTNTTAVNTVNTESYRQFDGHLLRFQLQVRY